MGLTEYKRKRKFVATPEPEGKGRRENLWRFVVQRHDASRLHYDLRLEMDGVLKSWAVPKGPSMNPADRRLAIETEDHPIEYLIFEGTIPQGNYGAGEMRIWDEGSYRLPSGKTAADAVKMWGKGDLKLVFDGKKLRGEFALVRMDADGDKKQWLLIKKKDDFATGQKYDPEEFSDEEASPEPAKVTSLNPNRAIKPMLASLGGEIFDDPEWIYERKWDGYRILAHVNDGQVDLYSRKGLNYNRKYPSVVEELKRIPHEAVLDGEIVAVDRKGTPSFQRLQHHEEDPSAELRYYVFDMLFLNGHSMLELPLTERKSLIPEVIEGLSAVRYSDHVAAKGRTFFKKAVAAGLEGVIVKKADSLYRPGLRTGEWLKIKHVQSQEAVICGYTESKKSSQAFESLILAVKDDGRLRYIGNCGSGFDHGEQGRLLGKMEALEVDESPFAQRIDLRGRTPHWVTPQLVCEVKFTEWTKNGMMRHPVYKGLRDDKSAGEIRRELPMDPKTPKTGQKGDDLLDVDGLQVAVTSLDKVYWPDSGLRKYDLIDYYIQMADIMMPYLKGRPHNLHRHPDGIAKPGFYQKDADGSLPDWAETVTVYSESADKEIDYLVCQNAATLVYMANLGCIEINPWHSRLESLEHPDYVMIDLDPTDKNTFDEVIEVALAVKEVLDEYGVDGWCKTSGSRGIHVYIPMGARHTYEEARDFAKLLCHPVKEMVPKLCTMERPLKDRKGRIYLDYLQNKSAQTMVAPYSVRPRKGAPVSAPLGWDELKKGLRITDFHIGNMAGRFEEKGDLFKGVLGKGVDLEKVLEKMEDNPHLS